MLKNIRLSQATGRILTFAAFILCFVSTAGAQGFIIPRHAGKLELKYYHADVNIKENIASFETVHKFHNPGPGTVQGVFYFPLPKDARITDFTLHADGKIMRGELLDADEARKIYMDIVRKALDPALLEMMDNNTFKASIFPIPAGKTRQIDVAFSTILEQHDGLVKFSLPFRGQLQTEGRILRIPVPRRGMPIELHRNTARPFDNREKPRRPLRSVELHIASATPINNIYSPSHDIEIDRKNDRKIDAAYEGRGNMTSGDFVVYYALDLSDVSMRMLTHREKRSAPGYFSLMISPRVELGKNTISAKDIILVVDVSGSMSGKKIEQAKESLRYWVDNLNARDRFGLITFSSKVEKFEDALLTAREGREDALHFIDKIEARGGTNINDALLAAFELAEQSENALIVFVTDGLPTSGVTKEKRILENVTESNPGNLRIFTYGLGYDVNTRLLDGVARETSAFSDYISPDENLEERISAFYDKIRYPMLTNVEIDFSGAEIDDVYPHDPPDLFKGQQLILFGRYETAGDFEIVLRGEMNGRRRSFRQRVSFANRAYDNEFVAPLWASRKIGYLLDDIQMNGESKELKDEVIALSKEFGILTPYTSYLAREDERKMEMTMMQLNWQGATKRSRISPQSADSDLVMSPKARSASGAVAVQASQAKNALKKAVIMDDAAESASGRPARRAGGRQFFLADDGYWNDIAAELEKPALHIKFGGDAYFTLLTTYPKLSAILSIANKMHLVWQGKTVKIDDSGVEQIDVQKLREIFE